jgi:L-rhamnose-H+ transport protein
MAPMKWIRGWSWENGWLVFSLTAYLAVPWMLALLTIPRLFEIYSGASAGALLSVCFFGCAWGIGAVTFGLGADALGMALGFAIILGIATTVGTLIPLVTAGSDLVSPKQLLLICLCLAILLLGVWVCSRAGKWKEGGQQKAIGYRRGVMICVASGVLSACGNLGFSFAGSITTRALNLGVPEFLAPNAVWTLLTVPLFLCNCGYALYRLGRFGSGASFRSGYAVRNVTLAIAMGALWMGGAVVVRVGNPKAWAARYLAGLRDLYERNRHYGERDRTCDRRMERSSARREGADGIRNCSSCSGDLLPGYLEWDRVKVQSRISSVTAQLEHFPK